MNHLKTYYESNSNQWFWKIDYSEWQKFIFDRKWEEFTDIEIDRIKDILDPYQVNPGNYFNSNILVSDVNIKIIKLKDEWYGVKSIYRNENDFLYYRCDQWDGLISCLEYCKNDFSIPGRRLKLF